MNRRSAVIQTRANRIEVQRTSEGQVAQMVGEATPLTDLVRAAGATSRPLRQTQYLHVSDLISRCVRKIAIVEQHKMVRQPQQIGIMDLLTYSVGDTIHDVIKGRASVGGPSVVWGNWTCACKTTKTEKPCLKSEVDPRQVCPACGGGLHTYTEVPIRDEDLKIVGTPDLLLHLNDYNALYVTELKSISQKQFDELTRPQPDHVIQILFYWYLLRRAGYRITNKVSVFYVTKGYMFKGSPYVEFVIDAEESVHRLDPYLETARELKTFRETGALPKRIVCSSDRSPEARKCEACNVCFGNNVHAPVQVNIAQALRRRS